MSEVNFAAVAQSDDFVRFIFLILKIVIDCRWGSYAYDLFVVGQNSCSDSMFDKDGLCVPPAELFLLFLALVQRKRFH